MSGSNFDKTWLQSSANKAAIARALELIETDGKGLPCRVTAVNGSIVTVAFEVTQAPWTLPEVTIPKAESNWIRTPTQVGDFGIALPAGAALGAIDGLGGGTATLALQGNLSNLCFVPIASTQFPAPPDQNKALVQGPAGAVIQTSDGNVVLTVNESGMTLVINGVTIFTVNASGTATTGTATATEDMFAFFDTPEQVGVSTHRHTQAPDSHGDVEQEISPPVPNT